MYQGYQIQRQNTGKCSATFFRLHTESSYDKQFLLQNKMLWKGEIIWEKNNYNCKYTAWGSWKSPASPYLKYTWEFIEVFCKGDLVKKEITIKSILVQMNLNNGL